MPRGRMRPQYTGRIGEGRVASVQCVLGTITVHLMRQDEAVDVDVDTPNITLVGRGSTSLRNFSWQLGGLTAEELTCLRQIVNLAFDLAEPVVEHRDARAAKALEMGDDSHARIFRQKPLFVVRPARRKAAHALGAELHNSLVDKLEAYDSHIQFNVNSVQPPEADEDDDFGGPDEYAGEDAADADINLPLEK